MTIKKFPSFLLTIGLLVILALVAGGFFQASANGPMTVPPPQNNGKIELLEFTSKGCTACQQLEPLIKEMLARDYPIRKIKMEDQQSSVLFERYKVESMPTFIMLVNEEEVGRLIGRGESIPEIQPRLLKMFGDALALAAKTSSTEKAKPKQMVISEPETDSLSNTSQSLPASMTAPKGIVPVSPKEITPLVTPVIQNKITDPMNPAVYNGAQSATVRIRCFCENGVLDSGTGTIIHANSINNNREALVLTCGHLFRDNEGKGRIEIDVFDPQTKRTQTVQGQCIWYDNDLDLAFVGIPLPCDIKPIDLVPLNYQSQTGEHYVSFGCNGGSDPTPLQHQLLSNDRMYFDPVKRGSVQKAFYYLHVSSAPVSGRSGGGLFLQNGNSCRLIGVCNAGDPDTNEGFFVPASVIYENLMANKNLTFVYNDMMKHQNDALLAPGQPVKHLQEDSKSIIPGNIVSTGVVGSISNAGPVINPVNYEIPEVQQSLTSSCSQNSPHPVVETNWERLRQYQKDGAEIICIVNWSANQNSPNKKTEVVRIPKDN